jgi:hypothetical protein
MAESTNQRFMASPPAPSLATQCPSSDWTGAPFWYPGQLSTGSGG